MVERNRNERTYASSNDALFNSASTRALRAFSSFVISQLTMLQDEDDERERSNEVTILEDEQSMKRVLYGRQWPVKLVALGKRVPPDRNFHRNRRGACLVGIGSVSILRKV